MGQLIMREVVSLFLTGRAVTAESRTQEVFSPGQSEEARDLERSPTYFLESLGTSSPDNP